MVGYVLRYCEAAKFIKDQLSQNIYGKPIDVRIECRSFLPDWRPDQDYRQSASARKELGGGVLLELSHEIDYANWLFGPLISIQAILQHSKTLNRCRGWGRALLENVNGLIVSIHLDFYCRNPRGM